MSIQQVTVSRRVAVNGIWKQCIGAYMQNIDTKQCEKVEKILHNCASRSVNLGRPVHVVPAAHIFKVIRVQKFNRLKAKFEDIEKKQENL